MTTGKGWALGVPLGIILGLIIANYTLPPAHPERRFRPWSIITTKQHDYWSFVDSKGNPTAVEFMTRAEAEKTMSECRDAWQHSNVILGRDWQEAK